MKKREFDFLVIGGGSGGVRAGRMAAGMGARVAMIEGGRLGGTCVNVGCVPKKLFFYSSNFSKEIEDSRSFGWSMSQPEFNWGLMKRNKDNEIERLNGVYARMMENAGVEVIKGWASFIDHQTVSVSGEEIKADNILIATGSRPRDLDVPGWSDVLKSDDFFEMKTLPENMLILGGGYIAVEFACILKGWGVDVTLAYRGPLFLRGFDDDVRTHLAQEMKQQGINIIWNSQVKAVLRQENQFQVDFEDGNRGSFESVLSAIGRVPNTHQLNLEKAGVDLDSDGNIVVNDYYQTSQPRIFAVGDVIGRAQLTPVALAEGMRVAHHLYGKPMPPLNYKTIPTAVFSQPTIGTCGYTETEARKKFPDDIHIFRSSFRPLQFSVSQRNEKSLVKLIVQKSTDKVLGMQLVGPSAGEITQGFAVAIQAGLTKSDFDQTIGIHPTLAEELVTMRTPVS